jgi:hypothetical protein
MIIPAPYKIHKTEKITVKTEYTDGFLKRRIIPVIQKNIELTHTVKEEYRIMASKRKSSLSENPFSVK